MKVMVIQRQLFINSQSLRSAWVPSLVLGPLPCQGQQSFGLLRPLLQTAASQPFPALASISGTSEHWVSILWDTSQAELD